jgi:hypothetical protein
MSMSDIADIKIDVNAHLCINPLPTVFIFTCNTWRPAVKIDSQHAQTVKLLFNYLKFLSKGLSSKVDFAVSGFRKGGGARFSADFTDTSHGRGPLIVGAISYKI